MENVDDFLFAVDLKGDGVKQTLWTQRFSKTTFFTPGQAEQVIIKKGKLVVEKAVRVPPAFRPMGAAFCNITGKDTRSLAFIDEYNRLQISTEGEELWRSSTSVGGGYMEVEQEYTFSSRTALHEVLQDRAHTPGRRSGRGWHRGAHHSPEPGEGRPCSPSCSRARRDFAYSP